MVQKKTGTGPKRLGRPRAYDPQIALKRAMDSFWQGGYAGTSLEDISTATGMNKPSLYAAFGDKHALYVEALDQYWELTFAHLRQDLAGEGALDQALMRAYDTALSVYFSGDGHPRGCFVIGTAVTEAVDDQNIRGSLLAGTHVLDREFEARFRSAREKGELHEDADPAALAMLATATMHTIAIRARAGSPRDELRALAQKAVGVICR